MQHRHAAQHLPDAYRILARWAGQEIGLQRASFAYQAPWRNDTPLALAPAQVGMRSSLQNGTPDEAMTAATAIELENA